MAAKLRCVWAGTRWGTLVLTCIKARHGLLARTLPHIIASCPSKLPPHFPFLIPSTFRTSASCRATPDPDTPPILRTLCPAFLKLILPSPGRKLVYELQASNNITKCRFLQIRCRFLRRVLGTASGGSRAPRSRVVMVSATGASTEAVELKTESSLRGDMS